MPQLTYEEFTKKYGVGLPANELESAWETYLSTGRYPLGETPDPADWPGTMPYHEWLAQQGYVSPKPPVTAEPGIPEIGFGGAYVPPGTTPTTPTIPTIPTMPTIPPITVPTITMPEPPTPPVIPEVPKVPPYERLPAQVALEEEYAEALREWREAGGYGIPEEVQFQMIQRATDILKAREAESIRVMRNNMERRGITNSGFVFANEMTIKSNTTLAIANSITDVQINSAFMKMASFEKMMGSTAQFIGYLAEESWKTYQPKMAQWEMEARYGLAEYGVAAEYGIAGYQAKVQATMAQFQANTLAVMTEWQTRMDLWKMEINQAYQQDNMELAAQIAADAAAQQHLYNIELAEMEIEAANQAAATEAAGNIFGTIIGGIFSLILK